MAQPTAPMVYHITHVDNLPSIVGDGGLWSDAEMIARGGPRSPIGMSRIKQLRLRRRVTPHPGLKVGACVPFFFCPRSVMLFVLHKANQADVTYQGGQGPIVHLEASLFDLVSWAESTGRRWAFTLGNAATAFTQFHSALEHLDRLDWEAVQSNDWRDPVVKEGKQAELLVEEFAPFSLVRRIGVQSKGTQLQAQSCLATSSHAPQIDIIRSWYY